MWIFIRFKEELNHTMPVKHKKTHKRLNTICISADSEMGKEITCRAPMVMASKDNAANSKCNPTPTRFLSLLRNENTLHSGFCNSVPSFFSNGTAMKSVLGRNERNCGQFTYLQYRRQLIKPSPKKIEPSHSPDSHREISPHGNDACAIQYTIPFDIFVKCSNIYKTAMEF